MSWQVEIPFVHPCYRNRCAGANRGGLAPLRQFAHPRAEKLHRRLKKERSRRHPAPDLRSHPEEGDWKLVSINVSTKD